MVSNINNTDFTVDKCNDHGLYLPKELNMLMVIPALKCRRPHTAARNVKVQVLISKQKPMAPFDAESRSTNS